MFRIVVIYGNDSSESLSSYASKRFLHAKSSQKKKVLFIPLLWIYRYIFDTSFVVFCPDNPDYYIEIPFSSILYCETYFSSQTREYFLFDSKEYYYNISFYFKYNNQVENCSFYTVPMSRRLERKYGKLLDGSDLYNYVNSNCLDKETYEYFYGRTY